MSTDTPQLVIFDCDGVLVDSERLAHEVVCELLAEHGLELSLADAIERFIGTSNPVLLESVTRLLGFEPAGFLGEFQRRLHSQFAAHLAAVPGIFDVVRALRIPCCVASNGVRADVTTSLGLTGLLPHFEDRIFCAEDVARPKPAPDLFLSAASRFAIMPARCVVVEDTQTGIRAARAAGMRALGYAAMTPADQLRQAGAHQVFHSMDQLLPMLGNQSTC